VQRAGHLKALLISFGQIRAATSIRPCEEIGDTKGVFSKEFNMRTVHYVGFRGDEYVRARRIWGGPAYIHKDYDDRVFTEVGDDDVVIFGPKYKYTKWVWDASGDC